MNFFILAIEKFGQINVNKLLLLIGSRNTLKLLNAFKKLLDFLQRRLIDNDNFFGFYFTQGIMFRSNSPDSV
jgi:hypothetical protein